MLTDEEPLQMQAEPVLQTPTTEEREPPQMEKQKAKTEDPTNPKHPKP